MIEYYLLEQFIGVVENGTLLKASEVLHVSQPSLTRSMKKLETELGVSLFYRENSRITLNETGKIAYEYAKKALQANSEFINQVHNFDRNQKTLSIGSCAPYPISDLIPIIQDYYVEKTIVSEIVSDESLLSGLKNNVYQLAIFHYCPNDKALYSQRYTDEQLYLSLPLDHPLVSKKTLSFNDMKDLKILMSNVIGFWMDIVLKHFDKSNLLIQSGTDVLAELVEASNLPSFNSDKMIKRGHFSKERINIPIIDEDAKSTYWIVCLDSEKHKYNSLFNSIRANIIIK